MQRDLEQPAALARLLRSLPHEAAPPYGWCEFQRRAARRALARPSRAPTGALAALTAIAAGIVAVSLRVDQATQQAQWPLQAPRPAGAAFAAAPSEMLERWLASLPDNPPLVQVGPRAAVTGLEDRLAEVDDLLTAERVDRARPAHLLALQQQRRFLVSSLAQVRYAEELVDESR